MPATPRTLRVRYVRVAPEAEDGLRQTVAELQARSILRSAEAPAPRKKLGKGS